MSSQPSSGHVRFFAHCAPPLTASDQYVLQVDQEIRDDIKIYKPGTTEVLVDNPNYEVGAAGLKKRQLPFAVTGPRFTLDAAEIHASYPPANAEGPFDTRLPMVVLRRRTLPWERELAAVGGDPEGDITPWVALLLFEEDEIKLLDPPNCTVGTIVNGDSSENVDALTGLPGTIDTSQPCLGIQVSLSKFKEVAPTLEELRLLAHARQVNTADKELLGQDKDGWFSVIVANRLPESGKKYVACLVSLEGHEAHLPTEHDVYEGGEFDYVLPSEVMRSRMHLRARADGRDVDLFNAGERNTAADATADAPSNTASESGPSGRIDLTAGLGRSSLSDSVSAVMDTAADNRRNRVSDALAGAATTDGGTVTPDGSTDISGDTASLYGGYNWGLDFYPGTGNWVFQPQPSLRFATLARWSFTCEGEGDFEGLMRALPYRGGIGMLGMSQDQTTVATAPRSFRVATDSGHVPLRHLSRAGEELTAFYRGPLVPAGVNRDTAGPYHSADQARRIDPFTGLENLGYASAFEIGRLMALSDASFAVSLLRWRRAGHRRVIAGINGALLRDRLENLLPDLRQDLLLDPRLLVEGLFDDIGRDILNEDLLGSMVDPSGLANIRDVAAGFDAVRVAEATGFEAGLINALLGQGAAVGGVGLEGAGHVLGSAGLVDQGMLENDFDALLGMAESAFAHLDMAREQTMENVNMNLDKGSRS